MNFLALYFCLGFMLTLLLLNVNVKFVKTTISSDKVTDEQIQQLYKSRPATAWKMHLAKSFGKYVGDYQELTQWYGKTGYKALNSLDTQCALITIKTTNELLGKSFKKIKRTNRAFIHVLLWFIEPNELTKRLFGKRIFLLYYNYTLLKNAKKQLEAKKSFNLMNDTKTLSEVLARSIISPNQGNIGILDDYCQSVFTKELIMDTLTTVSKSLGISLENANNKKGKSK